MALSKEDLLAFSDLMDQKLQPVNHRLDKMDSRLDKMDGRLDKMDGRLDKMESEISALKAGQISIKKELREVNHRVSETYDLAIDAWGASAENRNWLKSLPT